MKALGKFLATNGDAATAQDKLGDATLQAGKAKRGLMPLTRLTNCKKTLPESTP